MDPYCRPHQLLLLWTCTQCGLMWARIVDPDEPKSRHCPTCDNLAPSPTYSRIISMTVEG
jgi:rubrerythrin